MLSLILKITKRHIVHSFFSIITISSFLVIIRDSDTFFSCPARIEAFSIVSLALTLSSARAVNRFFTVLSVSAKSLV
jgi:hypothetical protein